MSENKLNAVEDAVERLLSNSGSEEDRPDSGEILRKVKIIADIEGLSNPNDITLIAKRLD